MLKVSKPLTADGLIEYHEKDYMDKSESYYSEKGQVLGQWRGQLAEDLGLQGGIDKEHFTRLAHGNHPLTNEVLVKHRAFKNENHKAITHRAGYDLTVSAPKSVSATACVGGDERIRQAHREAVDIMLREMEQYAQVRLSGGRVLTGGNWAVATFEHDTSRPVDGQVCPQLHTHCVLLNMGRDPEGKIRSLDPRELYRIQSYGTAIYRAELAHRLQQLGYEIERTKGHSFEIKGYTPEYLKALSLRRQRIQEIMAEQGLKGKAINNVALWSREKKLDLTAEEIKQLHRTEAAKFGHQPDKVVAETASRQVQKNAETRLPSAHEAITYAKHRLLERTAVFDQYEIFRDALQHGLGTLRLSDVTTAFESRLRQEKSEFVEVHHYRTHAPGHRYTTPEMQQIEKTILERIRDSRDSVKPICPDVSLAHMEELKDNPARQKVLERILATQDQFVAIQGAAGSRKTSGLMLLKTYIEQAGYEMVCYAPTGGAANELAARNLQADTLQALLVSMPKPEDATAQPRYYVLDETSLADTGQIHQFMQRVRPGIDHALFVGDDSYKRSVGQHKSVGAGRIFWEMQMGGMKTAELNRMYRQKTPELQAVASLLRDGKIEEAVTKLEGMNRVREVPKQEDRFRELTEDLAEQPERAYIVEPRNESRMTLNRYARSAFQEHGRLSRDIFTGRMLMNRDTRQEDTRHAQYYEPGDVLRYPKANQSVGVKAREYAEVVRVDVTRNMITVRREDGQEVTYDPKLAKGVQVYGTEERTFAMGERIQFTNPMKDKQYRIANRDTGTIRKLDIHGNAEIELDKDDGRKVRLNLNRMRHVEYAYAMTSQSLQGKTLYRPLFHVECGDPRNLSLLGKDMTYTALTRGEFDAVIYTDHKEELVATLSRECVKPTALSPDEIQAYRDTLQKRSPEAVVGPTPLSRTVETIPAPEPSRIAPTHVAQPVEDRPVLLSPQLSPALPDMAFNNEFRDLPISITSPAPKQHLVSPEEARAEFAERLWEAGLIVKGSPVMDGKLHRVPVEGGKPGNRSGAYIGHLDNHPAGWYKNYKTGEESRWSASAPTRLLTPEERAAHQREVERQRVQAELVKREQEQAIALWAQRKWSGAAPATDHPYLAKKGVEAHGLRQDEKGNLLVPMRSVDGPLWSLQRISREGEKHYTTGGKKQGMHYLLGDVDRNRPLVIAEGFATGATLRELSGLPVAVSFDSGNLLAVAQAYRERYSDLPIVLAADNDHHLPLKLTGTGKPMPNAGLVKAQEAAEAVKGIAIYPEFERGNPGTDWNDYAAQHGQEATKSVFMSALCDKQKDLSPYAMVATIEHSKHAELSA